MKLCPHCKNVYPDAYLSCPLDQSSLSSTDCALSIGSVIRGRYEVLSELGRGGMATVYKVRHKHFREDYALKIVHPKFMQDLAFLKRFRNEAVMVRQLKHKNAIKVFDLDQSEDGRPFILMELVEGRTLSDARRQNPTRWPPHFCLDIASQIADALAAAHSLGIIHRDIKPSNILLLESTHNISLKVMDFGIAKVDGAVLGGLSTVQTEHNLVIGTPEYMSPEQVSGGGDARIDGRSDIYSLGMLLYEISTGVHPFKADTPIGMALHQLHTIPASPRAYEPNLTEPLSTLILKSLEKDPDKRFQSASELLAALQIVRETLLARTLKSDPRFPSESILGISTASTLSKWNPHEESPDHIESLQTYPQPKRAITTPRLHQKWRLPYVAAPVLLAATTVAAWLTFTGEHQNAPASASARGVAPSYSPSKTSIKTPPSPLPLNSSFRREALTGPASGLHSVVNAPKRVAGPPTRPRDEPSEQAPVQQLATPVATPQLSPDTLVQKPRSIDPDELTFRVNATPEMLEVYSLASTERQRIMREHAIASYRRRVQGNGSVIDIIPPTLSSAAIFKATTADLRRLDAYEVASAEQQHAMRIQAVLHFTAERLGTPLTQGEEAWISSKIR